MPNWVRNPDKSVLVEMNKKNLIMQLTGLVVCMVNFLWVLENVEFLKPHHVGCSLKKLCFRESGRHHASSSVGGQLNHVSSMDLVVDFKGSYTSECNGKIAVV